MLYSAGRGRELNLFLIKTMPFHKAWIEMMRECDRRSIETKVGTWGENELFIQRAIEGERGAKTW